MRNHPRLIQLCAPQLTLAQIFDLIEENYRLWQENPDSVDSGWSAFFEGFELGNLPVRNGRGRSRASRLAKQHCRRGSMDWFTLIARWVTRSRGSIRWQRSGRKIHCCSLREFGFTDKDLDLRVSSKFFLDNRPMTLREMIAGLDRIYADSIGIGVHAHPESAHPRMGPAATGNASAQTFNASRGPGRAVAGAARSGVVRDFSAHPLRRAKTLFAPGRGIAHGRFSTRFCTNARTAASRRFAWAWRIAAGSMCWRIFCGNRSRSSSPSLARTTFPIWSPAMAT